METWPWSFLAARILALIVGVPKVVELASHVSSFTDWKVLLPPSIGLVFAIALWFLAGAFADGTALSIEDVRDRHRVEAESAAEDDGSEEDDPDGETLAFRPLATIALGVLGLYFIADAAPLVLFYLYRLISVLRAGESLRSEATMQMVWALVAVTARLGIGVFIFRSTDKLIDMLPARRDPADGGAAEQL